MKLTTNYSLKKPEGSDVVNIDDFNYNADIIDGAIQEVKSTSLTNASNISSLQTKVDNGQNYKITGDNGFTMQSGDCNDLNPNAMYYVSPSSKNIPHSSFNGYVETHCHGYGWGLQEAYDCFNTKKRYEREILNGEWQPWREL
jgi:hypothetical protein